MLGKFISFEGCDGVGKSTQIRLLKNYLDKAGVDVLLVREPGGNEISEKIREIILDKNNGGMSAVCELLLYYAARAQLIESVIRPALEKGMTVICDRFIDSSIAYQGYARGLGIDRVAELTEFVCKEVMPDATVFIDLPPEQAFRKRGGRDEDRIECEGLSFQNKVYDGFRIAADMFKERIISVKPSRDVAETGSRIIEELAKRRLIPDKK